MALPYIEGPVALVAAVVAGPSPCPGEALSVAPEAAGEG